jgi:hypothetical protein
MNKLIIAGNGFDLAHGLPTSYNNFMDAFWRDLKDNYQDEFFHKIIALDIGFFHEKLLYSKINNYNDFKESVDKFTKEMESLNSYGEGQTHQFENNFFKELNEIQSIQNWVDVENEYYQALKDICKDGKLEARQKREEVLKLHKEFEEVKQLLERYLKKNVVEVYDFYVKENVNKFIDIIKPLPIFGDHISLLKEFSLEDDRKYLVEFLQEQGRKEETMTNVRLLNFNYTPTLLFYGNHLWSEKTNISINHIHGELNKNIVFGFGDEMDDDYKLIEDMDDNEYLKYFKSFQYVQNSNYKDVLRYVDSEKFQVIIMGHSCGLSDRTLLNTIFEHENCRSIKVYYYKNGDYDNYTEIIQNISRHFNDKKLMRTKIVEKTLCEPMPQIQLPRKT